MSLYVLYSFKKSLEDAIHSDTSGHFCRILVSLAQGARDEGLPDMAKVLEDSQTLADACNADSDDRIDKFMSILCTRSFPHLRKVFQEFVKCSNKDIEQIIKKEMSGDVKNVMFAIVRSVKNQPSYLADRLYKAMKGLGTDDRALIRIMVSRSEIDLFNIRKEFKDTHDASLHEFIQVETMVRREETESTAGFLQCLYSTQLFRNFPSALNFLSVQLRDRKSALTGLHQLHHQNSL
ncbi:annexin A6 isoform X1 [Tachysurus ichikawai]